jgi:hypothetical protein
MQLTGQGSFPTKEIVGIPVWQTASSETLDTPECVAVARCNAINDRADFAFRVPHDFVSIKSAFIRVIPRATQAAADWNIYSYYGGLGEHCNIHAESDLVTTFNVTDGDQFDIDISGILTNLSKDDSVTIRLVEATAGHNFDARDMRFQYA